MVSKILAAGASIRPSGMLQHRIVLRQFTDDGGVIIEFVTHVQAFNEDGSHNSYSHGSYFPVRSFGKGGTAVMAAFEAAYKSFQKRDAEKVLSQDYAALFIRPAVVAAGVRQFPGD